MLIDDISSTKYWHLDYRLWPCGYRAVQTELAVFNDTNDYKFTNILTTQPSPTKSTKTTTRQFPVFAQVWLGPRKNQ